MDRETTDADLGRTYPTGDEGDASDGGCPCSATGDAMAGGRPSIYQDFYGDCRAEMERRDYAKALATIGGLTAVGSLTAPLLSLTQVFEREYTGPIYSDGVALVDDAGERIQEGRLSAGEQLTVFPEPRPGLADSPTLLVRFEEGEYGGDTNLEYTVGGYAAYSKVCTHAGCMVADRDGTTMVCPCHSGRFDPLSGAAVTGGPPPRKLPQLPITLSSEGHLVATADFEGTIGPGGE
ncbi:ubiquinol-cytochrome c reductase iron-sulfur subunit [Halorientalis halophila]|uniref:QcrA and Rieske domain-containing protein n=1 Tax=Halorientalis halophila TaxID=3108499 RepID=UPI003AB36D0F